MNLGELLHRSPHSGMFAPESVEISTLGLFTVSNRMPKRAAVCMELRHCVFLKSGCPMG